jgi:hypothetical protein
MGGSAFANEPCRLYTPRMPPQAYARIRDACQHLLQQHYALVATPIEAPAKIDHGDIDILVAEALSSQPPCGVLPLTEHLSAVLGATKSIAVQGNPTVSLALRWPSDVPCHSKRPPPVELGEDSTIYEVYVQVDVHVCTDPADFHWTLFHHAHGDLWNLLGSSIRRYGLTVNNRGLHLRIPELEDVNRKRSLVFLTCEPQAILDFLGLSHERYWSPFASVEEMFAYAAGHRFFHVRPEMSASEVVRELKHNDRHRMKTRPVFTKWITEFIPDCRDKGLYSQEPTSRDQVREEALVTFRVEEEYRQRRDDFLHERDKEETWKLIKENVPFEGIDPQLRAAAVKGLKALILEDNHDDGINPQLQIKDSEGTYLRENVCAIVDAHWAEIGHLRMERGVIKMKEKMRQRDLERDEKASKQDILST